MREVLIRGDGVAARCCGHLLAQAGYRVSFERTSRTRVPLIMLSEAAQRLIGDVFHRNDFFRDERLIRKRIVAWGDAAPVELDHSAVVLPEEDLLNRLGAPGNAEGIDAEWTICAAAPLPAATAEHRFGARIAAAMPVKTKASVRRDACWIESVEDGWLFLNLGWLLAVGANPEGLLEKSRLVKDQIFQCGSAIGQFPASPRMVVPLGGEGWISCGTAAMAFDPLCGDGTAHAVREAILASAVIRASDRGEDTEALLSHYEARLTAGFQRHLILCREFYSSGGGGSWWKAELAAVAEGLTWSGRRMENYGRFRYRLDGFELAAHPTVDA